jgi:hypothetical protein
MKKYKEKKIKEVSAVICDLYPKEKKWNGSNAFARMYVSFSYGSKFDGTTFEMDLSDKAVEEIMGLIEEKYGKEKIQKHCRDNHDF